VGHNLPPAERAALKGQWSGEGIVVEPAFNSLVNHPLGDGLGRSGHGVPIIFYNLVQHLVAGTVHEITDRSAAIHKLERN